MTFWMSLPCAFNLINHYREEDFYFYGEDDRKNAEKEQEQTFDLHVRFWNKIVLEQKKYEELRKYTDMELYNCCIDDIVKISRLPEHKVVNVVNYLINDGKMNLLEFPLFEVEDSLVTIPSLILVNDWQFTIINGHYLKNIIISNREKTISTVTEERIEKALLGVTNVAVAKTVPYSFKDELGNELNSDIDYAIYDFTHNKALIIEAKWIDKHYKDEIDKIYGKIFQTLNSIYTKQIDKHKKFLQKQENIDFLFSNDKNYRMGLPTPEIYYLAVDKRNQMHIDERHMVSEYMLIYFIHKYVSDNQIDLESMWKEINGLQTKVEYIAVSNDYFEISVGDEVVLVEQDDLYWR